MAVAKVKTPTGNPRWEVRYRNHLGKQRKRRFESKADAETFEAKVKVSKKENRYPEVFEAKPEIQITVDGLLDEYKEKYRHSKSWKTNKKKVLKFLRSKIGHLLLREVNYKVVEQIRDDLVREPIKRGGCGDSFKRSNSTVNKDLTTFRHILNKAVQWDYIDVNPFHKGERLFLKPDPPRQRFLTGDEINKLLSQCDQHLFPLVVVALETGMRRGEIFSLTWKQIRGGLIYLDKTKSGYGRQIPISPKVEKVFKDQRKKNHLKSEFVFPGKDGKQLTDLKNSFRTACKNAEIDDFRFHDLRHTFASQLVMKRVPLQAVKELLGHRDIKTTLRYAHLHPDFHKEAIRSLDGIISDDVKPRDRNPVDNIHRMKPYREQSRI